jgi:hypothetical protein
MHSNRRLENPGKRRENGTREDAITLLGLGKLRPEIDPRNEEDKAGLGL